MEHSSKRRRISASTSLGSSSDLLIPGLIDDIALNCLSLVSRLDYPSLSCVNNKYNKLINGGNLLGLRKKLGIVEYLVFMVRHSYVGGWVLFSPMKNKWLVLPEPPNDEYFNNKDQLVSLAVNDEVLLFRNFSEDYFWKFSLGSWCWVKCEDTDSSRLHFASGSLGDIAIIAGGVDEWMKILALVDLYDSSTGEWEILPDMHTPRMKSSGFFMDGKFYVIGGLTDHFEPVTFGEEFDLETRKWRKIEGMYPNVNPAPGAPLPNFAVVNDELYEYLNYVVKKYDKANNKWEAIGRLPLDLINSKGIEIKGCGDLVLVFCKKAGDGKGQDIVVYSWCPKSGVKDGNLDLKVVGFKDNFGIYNTTTVMGC